MPSDINYKKIVKQQYKKNIADTHRALENGELDKKINNFCAMHGFDYDEIKQKIYDDPVVTALFAKNPKRQNIYEKAAAEFIQKINGVKEFVNLPQKGKTVNSGAVINISGLSESGGAPKAKTIDFEWVYRGYTFYASHKYTDVGGGSQDHQYDDLKSFINEAGPSNLKNTYFVAIADGDYYLGQNGQANTTKIDRLKNLCTNIVFACQIKDLESLMKEKTK